MKVLHLLRVFVVELHGVFLGVFCVFFFCIAWMLTLIKHIGRKYFSQSLGCLLLLLFVCSAVTLICFIPIYLLTCSISCWCDIQDIIAKVNDKTHFKCYKSISESKAGRY